MATFTAQILVGSTHPYDGGIIPTHCVYLSENSRPAWILRQVKDTSMKENKITWIPTLEHMLEDALLMIALHVGQDMKLVEMAKQYFSNDRLEWAELYQDVDREGLSILHKKCKEIDTNYKVVISVLEGSTIWNQIATLEEYQKLEVEVCLSQYRRARSIWSGAMSVYKGDVFE